MSKEMITKLMMEDAIQYAVENDILLGLYDYIRVYKEHCKEYDLIPDSHIMEECEKAERELEEKMKKYRKNRR